MALGRRRADTNWCSSRSGMFRRRRSRVPSRVWSSAFRRPAPSRQKNPLPTNVAKTSNAEQRTSNAQLPKLGARTACSPKPWRRRALSLKAPNTNIQAPENVQMPITKRTFCQRAHQSWCLGVGASMELGGWRLVLRAFTRHFDAFLFHIRSNCRRRFSLFHLVSPGFSYKEQKNGTGRLKTDVFSYGESDARDFHAFRSGVLRLVAPGCSLLQLPEKIYSARRSDDQARNQKE